MDETASIEVDEELVQRAMRLTGEETPGAAVQRALQELVDRSKRRHEGMQELEGIGWEGDLDEMRRDRDFD